MQPTLHIYEDETKREDWNDNDISKFVAPEPFLCNVESFKQVEPMLLIYFMSNTVKL